MWSAVSFGEARSSVFLQAPRPSHGIMGRFSVYVRRKEGGSCMEHQHPGFITLQLCWEVVDISELSTVWHSIREARLTSVHGFKGFNPWSRDSVVCGMWRSALETPGTLNTQASLLNRRDVSVHILPRRLGVDVVNSQSICAIYRVGPHLNLLLPRRLLHLSRILPP